MNQNQNIGQPKRTAAVKQKSPARNIVRVILPILMAMCLMFGMTGCDIHAGDKEETSSVRKRKPNSNDSDSEYSSGNSGVENTPEPSSTEAILKMLEENRGLANRKPTISARYHTIAIKNDGAVKRNGYNKYGQCDVYGWQDIVSVSAGNYHSLGLRSDGTVVAVGLNESKQCNVSDWRDIVAISAGVQHSVGLRSDGTVVATGMNYSGECDVSDWRDIIAVSAGNDYTIGLKSNGTVVTTRSFGGFSSWNDIVAIDAGQLHAVGIKSDGSVVTVVDSQYNYYGQGNILGWSDIIAVSTGTYFTVGLKADGTVVAAGDNQYGQCNVSGWKDIVAIAAGEEYTIGIKADGTAVATGNNEDGACNVSDWADIAMPGTRSVDLSSGSQGGSANSAPTPMADYSDIDKIFSTRVGDLVDSASDVNTSFMGYSIDYKGKYGTFYIDVMTDIYDSSHINDIPNAIQFPIKMLIPGKSSYTLDELESIFGWQLSVDYYTDGMDGPGYSVIVNGKYYIQFTNGSKTMYDNNEVTSPFTSCYINRFNNFN